MKDLLEIVIMLGIFIFAIVFIFGAIAKFYGDNKDKIKSVANLAKNGAKKSLDCINQNTSKVRDYAIIIVCIAVVIALIAFFAR